MLVPWPPWPSWPPARGRGLRVEAAAERYALVATAVELLAAVEQGTPHIRITGHIDLTRTAVTPLDFQIRILSSIKSITGACTEAPVLRDFNLKPEAPLLPLERGQCLLVTQSGLLKSASGPLWLDNLYIRRELPAPEAEVAAAAVDAELSPLVVTDKPEGLLWATGVVFQGDGAGGAAAVEILSAAYFDRCKFANFGGGSVPVLLYGGSASVSLERCTFVRNSGPTAADGARSGLVVLSGSGGGFVRLEGCTFESNAVDYVAVDDSDIASGRIFADNAEMGMWRAATQEVLFARPLAEAEAIGFVDDEWRWFPLTVEEAAAARDLETTRIGCLVLFSGMLAALVADHLVL